MKARKPGHVGVDLGEWVGLIPIVATLVRKAATVKGMPKGVDRSAAIRALVFVELDALVEWLDNALDD